MIEAIVIVFTVISLIIRAVRNANKAKPAAPELAGSAAPEARSLRPGPTGIRRPRGGPRTKRAGATCGERARAQVARRDFVDGGRRRAGPSPARACRPPG